MYNLSDTERFIIGSDSNLICVCIDRFLKEIGIEKSAFIGAFKWNCDMAPNIPIYSSSPVSILMFGTLIGTMAHRDFDRRIIIRFELKLLRAAVEHLVWAFHKLTNPDR